MQEQYKSSDIKEVPNEMEPGVLGVSGPYCMASRTLP